MAASTSCREADQRIALLNGRLASREETIASLTADHRSLRLALEEEGAARAVDKVALTASRGQVWGVLSDSTPIGMALRRTSVPGGDTEAATAHCFTSLSSFK